MFFEIESLCMMSWVADLILFFSKMANLGVWWVLRDILGWHCYISAKGLFYR